MQRESNKKIWGDVFCGEITKEKIMLQSHSHNYYEISCVFKGSVDVFYREKKYNFIDNSFILTPPRTPHHIRVTEGEYYRHNIYFERSALDKLIGYSVKLDKLFETGGIVFKMLGDTPDMTEKLFKIFSNETDEETQILLLGVLLNEIIANTKLTSDDESSTSYIDDVERMILKEYADRLVASELANRFFISRTKLMTDFKKKTGKTVNEYITFVRLEMAKEMLISGKSVYETAVACGFVNGANFTRLFKKHFSICPKDYRKNFSS